MRPDIAIAYLQELSTHIRAVAIATAEGELLAGEATLLGAQAGVTRVADERHQVLVALHPGALPSLVEFDLRSVLGDLVTR